MLHEENIGYFINISSEVNVAMMDTNILKTVCGRMNNCYSLRKCVEQLRGRGGKKVYPQTLQAPLGLLALTEI